MPPRCFNVPAGSFKCERFVRSSLASSIVGFISGGRLAPSDWSSATVVSMVFAYSYHTISNGIGLDIARKLYLSIVELEDEDDLVPVELLRLHL